jgi:hypothetical protein
MDTILDCPSQSTLSRFGCARYVQATNGFKTSRFAEKFQQTTAEEVLAGEFLLCQGIRFAFDVRHPFRALEGAVLELRRNNALEVSSNLF